MLSPPEQYRVGIKSYSHNFSLFKNLSISPSPLLQGISSVEKAFVYFLASAQNASRHLISFDNPEIPYFFERNTLVLSDKSRFLSEADFYPLIAFKHRGANLDVPRSPMIPMIPAYLECFFPISLPPLGHFSSSEPRRSDPRTLSTTGRPPGPRGRKLRGHEPRRPRGPHRVPGQVPPPRERRPALRGCGPGRAAPTTHFFAKVSPLVLLLRMTH